jgi:hypothetical protein
MLGRALGTRSLCCCRLQARLSMAAVDVQHRRYLQLSNHCIIIATWEFYLLLVSPPYLGYLRLFLSREVSALYIAFRMPKILILLVCLCR